MKKSISILLLGILVLLGISCQKKAKEEETAPKTNAPVTSAEVKTSSITPGDVVTLKFDAEPSESSYQIKVGDKEVSLVKTNGNEFQFIMPVGSPGATNIDLNSVGLKNLLNLEIANYSTITDPEPIITDYKERMEAALVYVEKYSNDTINPISYSHFLMVKSFRDNIDALFGQMTKEEKIEVSYFLQKVKIDTIGFADITKSSSKINFKTAADDKSNRFVAIGKAFVTTRVGAAASIILAAMGLGAPEPTMISKAIGIVAGFSAAVNIAASFKLVETLCNEIGIQYSFKEFMTNKPAAGAPDIYLSNNVPLNFQINSNYRKLTTSDEANLPSSLVKDIFSGINSMKEQYNKFRDKILTKKIYFIVGEPSIPEYTSSVKTSIISKVRPTPSENLTLNNVSDPQIKVTYLRDGNFLKIVATSSTVTAKRTFTFDVVYENTELNITTKKTITAEFDPVTCKLFGSWKVSQYDMYGNDLLNGDYYNTVLGGCANSFNNYTINYKYDNWTLKFFSDGTFENMQYFTSGSYKEYVPNGGIVCSDRSTANFYTLVEAGAFDYNYFNTNNSIALTIKRVYHSVGGVYMDDTFVATLIDDNTLKLVATYNGYSTTIILTRQ